MEISDLVDSKIRAFSFKIEAAVYHKHKMQLILSGHEDKFLAVAKDATFPAPKKIRPFFFHYDAFLFELVSCFDIILHIVRIKNSLPLKEEETSWNKKFKWLLQQNNRKAYELLEKKWNEWWFEDLRNARNYITHNDRLSLGIEVRNNGDNLFFFALPKMHERREIFEHCTIWIKEMRFFDTFFRL